MNRNRLTVTMALIIINAVVFLVGMMVQRPAIMAIAHMQGPMTSIFEIVASYSWFTCFKEWQLWRLVTYQFVHANGMHLLFNMWALYFFGPMVEAFFGPRRFLAYYLACGVAGALFASLLASLGIYSAQSAAGGNDLLALYLAQFTGYQGLVHFWEMVPLVGASASIYGLMVAVAILAPDGRISLLFPPVTMTMRTFAMVVIGIAVAVILFNGGNAGGEAGHLGGIIMGAAIMGVLKWRYRF